MLLSSDGYIKAVGEHKTRKNQANFEAQWAAEAIAAAQYNNHIRSTRNLPFINHMIMGLIMIGARPCFCRMLVTVALANAVALGNIPPTATALEFYDLPVSVFGFETARYRKVLFDATKLGASYCDAADVLWLLILMPPTIFWA